MEIKNGNGRQKKAEITRRKLFEAGISLMREKGFHAATIRSICDRAGVSVGTFYLYYNTKSDIINEIYMHGDDFMVSGDYLDAAKTSRERIALFIDRYAELTVRTGLDSVKVLYNPDNEWFSQFRSMQKKMKELICEAKANGEMKNDLPAEVLTDFLFVCMRGVCYNWSCQNGGYDIHERMQKYMGLVLSALIQ